MSGAIRAEPIRVSVAAATRVGGRASGVSPANSLERWHFVAALSLIGILPFLLGAQPSGAVSAEAARIFADEGDPAKQAVLALVYASFGVLLVWRVRLARLLTLGAPLIALVLLCAASALWSDLPLVALRRSAALAGTVTLGVYAALRFDIDELLELLCRVVAIVLVASFALAAFEPSLGLDSEGRLRGVYAHKNTFGIFAALGLLALIARFLRRPSRDSAVFCALCAVGCLTGLVLADSASPLPALVVGLGFMTWVHRSRASPGWLVPSLIAAGCAAAIALPVFSDAFGVFALVVGRDADFSHRDVVWRFALELFSRNPWLGYGYEAFWNGAAGELFFRIAGFAVSHAHNGYLQLALDTGIVGLLAFLCALAMLISRALALLAAGYRPHVAWLVGFTAFYVVASATESHAWKTNDLLTLLFVYAVVRTNVLAEDRRA